MHSNWLARKIAASGNAMTYFCLTASLISLPQTIYYTVLDGFHALPLATWLLQSVFQVVFLSSFMAAQGLIGRETESRVQEKFDSILKTLDDMRKQ